MSDASDEDMLPAARPFNNRSAEEEMQWQQIIINVEALDDAICMVGEFAESELSFSASFLAMVKELTGAENPLTTLLQPSVNERIPAILFQLYVVRRQIAHIHQQLASYPALVEYPPMPRAVTIDFSRPIDAPLNVGVHINMEDGHGSDTE